MTDGTLTITPASTSGSITWNPAALTYGVGLGAAQFNATSTIAGSFTYNQAAGTVLGAGPQTLTATFTPTDTTDYATQSVSATLTVNKAPLAVTAANATRAYGAANPTFTGTITGAVNGDSFTESFTTTATLASAAGSYPITPTAAGTALGNYTVTVTDGTLTITPASTSGSITWNPAALTYGVGLGAAQFNATSTIAGSFTYNQAAGTILGSRPADPDRDLHPDRHHRLCDPERLGDPDGEQGSSGGDRSQRDACLRRGQPDVHRDDHRRSQRR